jgi:hypothetical protein
MATVHEAGHLIAGDGRDLDRGQFVDQPVAEFDGPDQLSA